MENKYYIVNLSVSSAHTQVLDECNMLAMKEYSCGGVEEFSLEEARVDEILGMRAYSGGDVPESVLDEVEDTTKSLSVVSYKYYFYEGDSQANAKKFHEVVSKKEEISFSELKEEENEDWNKTWRKHYAPIEVSDELHIVPEWFKKENEPHHIYIYPGMGFGTGEHETTFLCLKLYDEVKSSFKRDDFCFDFGCGSGILGIAAIKLNDMLVEFCDIDKSALDNCMQNLELNFGENLNGHRLVIRERYESGKKYKLVFANILENVLVLEKDIILNSLDESAYLVVSGLLNHQVENIKNEYSELEYIKDISKGDWSAILFKRK